MNRNLQAVTAIVVSVVVSVVVAAAGGSDGTSLGGSPVFWWCAGLAFVINWAVFVPSYLRRTERFYDLTGTITYLSVTALAVVAGNGEPRSILLAAMVAIWALRLGIFLFVRITADGSDGRFDELKQAPLPFLQTWTLQGLWVVLTAGCALAAMTATSGRSIGWLAVVGLLVWCGGLGLEAVADSQKRRFRANESNEGRFIDSGVWSWSRHPNYFGEITLWIGVALVAVPALSGWQFVTLISPFFVILLLTKVSGIPMLEARATKRWGDDPAYQRYVDATPVLVPRPPQR